MRLEEPPTYLSRLEVAERLGISISGLHGLIKSGKLPPGIPTNGYNRTFPQQWID
jgi:predicted DNA-binding transcriptional regulator AlpA